MTGDAGRGVLVTGGSGFLGHHVVRDLVLRGQRPRVLVRGTYEPMLDRIAESIELVRGDVVEDGPGMTPLERALEGVSEVYHLAGMVSRDPDATSAMMRVHVDGTKRVLHAAKKAGVRRVVVASSSGTIAVSRTAEPIRDETSGYATDVVSGWPYYLSKIYQEKVSFELGASLGIEVVVVNPSLLLGPGDRRGSSTGDVLRFLRREFPTVPTGGVNFVDARDAASATLDAMERGRPGERYLLGGPNWTIREFFARLGRVAKMSPPRVTLPARWERAGASLLEHVYQRFDRSPPIDRISVEMAQVFWYCDSSKAEAELAFEARDPAETLDETVRWLKATPPHLTSGRGGGPTAR